MARNQTTTTGPNTLPTPEAPLNWTAKRTTRSPIVIGATAARKAGPDDVEPLDGREHADRRRDHAVADQEARASDQRPEEHARAAIRPVVQEAVEREHAALAVVLRAQDEEGVLDRDDEGQRPDGERGGAERVLGRARGDAEDLVHGVERRGADRAEHDAERAERQRRDAAAGRVIMRVPGGVRVMGSVDEKRHGLGRIFAILQWESAAGNACGPRHLRPSAARVRGRASEFLQGDRLWLEAAASRPINWTTR